MVSEQTRQLVTETLQQVTRSAEVSQGQTPGPDGSRKDETGGLAEACSLTGEASQSSTQGAVSSKNPLFISSCVNVFPLNQNCVCFLSSEVPTVVHVLSSREQDWTEQEVAVESSPTIIYQEVPGGESQSATSTIKALVELQQTSGEASGQVFLLAMTRVDCLHDNSEL